MKHIQVSIIMGSDSDLAVMKDAALVLDEFQITYEITIVSAHRSPHAAHAYGKEAAKRGVKVIIAGAGGAAHLAGVVAALTTVPVIGVPMLTKSLGGVDSLYSIVQMPPGIPVATVGINSAKNAGLLAIAILALSDAKLSKKLMQYKKTMEEGVIGKAKKLQKIGFEKYLSDMKVHTHDTK